MTDVNAATCRDAVGISGTDGRGGPSSSKALTNGSFALRLLESLRQARSIPLKDTRPKKPSELTFRGILVGDGITVVFMTANVYLGLRTGMTFSSSIRTAIISMSVLKALSARGAPAGILENNIVQTQAPAAGTLCNVIVVLPGLVLIGFWPGFPLSQTMAICLLGGLPGVAYSAPLRPVMVVGSNLPFPEGVAAAEVLRAGHRDEAGAEGDTRAA